VVELEGSCDAPTGRPASPPQRIQRARWRRADDARWATSLAGPLDSLQLQVADLGAPLDALRAAGIPFRSNLIRGIGGNQVILEDRSGNPVELVEPVRWP
jgi:hypothetical protein